MFTYTELKEAGLINNLMIVHPVYDKIIPLENVCQSLFGVKTLPITTCIIKLELDNIIIKYNDYYYVVISRFGHFLDKIGCLDKYMDKYLVINYCNFLGQELTGIQKDVYNFNKMFIDYLEKDKLTDKYKTNNREKKLIFNHNTIIKMIGKDHFNGLMAGYEKYTNILMINYDNHYISYGYDNFNEEMYVSLKNVNDMTFQKLAADILQSLLKTNVDEYVYYNLLQITGSNTFARMLVTSHNNPNECVIPIDAVTSMIQFKNEKLKQNYNIKFMTIYKNNPIWKEVDDDILFNFKGLNYYYLNLDDSFIDNKDEVNELYYEITNELINSYKALYNYLKL